MFKKKYLYIFLTFFVITIAIIFILNTIVEKSTEDKLFSDAASIPYNKVGVILGTAKYIKKGIHNPYYDNRIDAAAQLFKYNKIKYLIISGDNGTREYNEPFAMRRDLMKAGIDSSRLFMDHAGFRTFDSMKRLKEVFGQDSATIISQPFHNQRAIYIANHIGVYAIGFNAEDVDGFESSKMLLREKLARVKVFLDFLFGTKPKYLGPKINIPL